MVSPFLTRDVEHISGGCPDQEQIRRLGEAHVSRPSKHILCWHRDRGRIAARNLELEYLVADLPTARGNVRPRADGTDDPSHLEADRQGEDAPIRTGGEFFVVGGVHSCSPHRDGHFSSPRCRDLHLDLAQDIRAPEVRCYPFPGHRSLLAS